MISRMVSITKTCLRNRLFKAVKIENFHLKNFDTFIVFAQNIDCAQ